MKILGISRASTYGAGVLFDVETLHVIGNTSYIITWGYNAQSWHKFVGIRKESDGYAVYETYQEVETRFKKKKKAANYLFYLDRILNQLDRETGFDKALAMFEQAEIELYIDIKPLVKNVIRNVNRFTSDFKKKIIQNRKSYVKQKFGSINGMILLKMLN